MVLDDNLVVRQYFSVDTAPGILARRRKCPVTEEGRSRDRFATTSVSSGETKTKTENKNKIKRHLPLTVVAGGPPQVHNWHSMSFPPAATSNSIMFRIYMLEKPNLTTTKPCVGLCHLRLKN